MIPVSCTGSLPPGDSHTTFSVRLDTAFAADFLVFPPVRHGGLGAGTPSQPAYVYALLTAGGAALGQLFTALLSALAGLWGKRGKASCENIYW